MTYEIPKHLILEISAVRKLPVSAPSTREIALEKCLANYEIAMTESRDTNKTLEKELKTSRAALTKLVNAVKHNARNAETILRGINL